MSCDSDIIFFFFIYGKDFLTSIFSHVFHQKANKSKNRLLGKEELHVLNSATQETSIALPPHLLPSVEEVKLTEVEKEVATAAVAEDAIVSSAEAAAEVVQSTAPAKFSGKSTVEVEAAAKIVQATAPAKFSGKSKEEVAAITIQTAFRGYQVCRCITTELFRVTWFFFKRYEVFAFPGVVLIVESSDIFP